MAMIPRIKVSEVTGRDPEDNMSNDLTGLEKRHEIIVELHVEDILPTIDGMRQELQIRSPVSGVWDREGDNHGCGQLVGTTLLPVLIMDGGDVPHRQGGLWRAERTITAITTNSPASQTDRLTLVALTIDRVSPAFTVMSCRLTLTFPALQDIQPAFDFG